jgi:small-conductance mechanosensitive channel
MNSFSDFLSSQLISTEQFNLTVGQLLSALIILLLAKVVLLIAKRIKKKHTLKTPAENGRYHSLYLIFSYVVWIIALLSGLQAVGVELNVLLASGAALLVGIGLGLQSLFHDFVSGIIMLFEGTIEVGDVIEVDGILGRVQKITIRNSLVWTQNDYTIIIPNHFFVSEKVINWTHNVDNSRFHVNVGVAYGSDTSKVIKILESCAAGFEGVSKKPLPFARFEAFGDSSLDFKLFFWCNDPFKIEPIKGRLRLMIDQKFREEGVTIPFPQRDLHIVSDQTRRKES